MPRTLSSTRAPTSKAGFTLLEMLIVIAVMALLTAVAVPNMQRIMDWSAKQGAFFDFQRQISGLRATAFHGNQTVMVVNVEEAEEDPTGDAAVYPLAIEAGGWTYLFAQPLVISPGGVCAETTAQLLGDDGPLLNLESRPDCRFVQVRQ